jgi:GTP-binding protein
MQHRTWKNVIAGGAEFILGISHISDVSKCGILPMIAFVGASNVGKSTLINEICANQNLSRTSKFPGHTRQVNIFKIDQKFLLADMPGYGFAKRSKIEILRLKNLIFNFLAAADGLRLVNVLIDIRKGLRPHDIEIIEHLSVQERQVQVILTKSDHISQEEQIKEKDKMTVSLHNIFGAQANVILFSSKFSVGVKELGASMVRSFSHV